ncbi:MAG: hypothetical protein WCS05_04215, partial [Bacteroidales bacterium]
MKRDAGYIGEPASPMRCTGDVSLFVPICSDGTANGSDNAAKGSDGTAPGSKCAAGAGGIMAMRKATISVTY